LAVAEKEVAENRGDFGAHAEDIAGPSKKEK
jgi:hypothetical protein